MKVAIFDFDGTLFPVETIPFLIKQYVKLGHSRFKQVKMMATLLVDLAIYKSGIKPDKELFRHKAVYKFLSLFDGMSKEEVHYFFKQNVEIVSQLLDEEIIAEVNRRKEEGYHTVLLSGCFDMLLIPLGKALGFDEIVGTKLIFSEISNNRAVMNSKNPIHIVSGENKLKAAKALGLGGDIDWKASVGYADSSYDQPMLELVGEKVAVNPDQQLEKIATEKNWTILVTQKGLEKVKYS